MKSLNQLVSDNIEKFNGEEPENGHFEKFMNKLNTDTKKKSMVIPMWAKISGAAVFLALVTFSFIFSFKQKEKMENSVSALTNSTINISSEFSDVEFYYQRKISEQMNELKNLNCKVDNSDKQKVMRDLLKLDLNYQELQKELLKNGKNEHIINAMIKNYKTKSDLLEKVVTQIKQNC